LKEYVKLVVNQRQWQVASILPAEQVLFQKEREKWGKGPVAAHNSYLINLAAKNEETRIKSVHAMADEIGRVAALGIPYLIMHPGSHGGDGVEAGLDRFVNNLDAAMGSVKQCDDVMVLLENTAGQGTGLGSAFNELSYIINNSRYKERLGVCLDTCHLFAAGYDFRTPEKYKETFQLFETEVGIDRIRFFHINDSKKALGSRVDRHEHIGKGEIGLEGFRNLVNDERFRHHPMTLETPKGKDLLEDIENLAVLKSLIR
jgi:deoxyribonuclease-4